MGSEKNLFFDHVTKELTPGVESFIGVLLHGSACGYPRTPYLGTKIDRETEFVGMISPGSPGNPVSIHIHLVLSCIFQVAMCWTELFLAFRS